LKPVFMHWTPLLRDS